VELDLQVLTLGQETTQLGSWGMARPGFLLRVRTLKQEKAGLENEKSGLCSRVSELNTKLSSQNEEMVVLI
jgi:hypothetical protein